MKHTFNSHCPVCDHLTLRWGICRPCRELLKSARSTEIPEGDYYWINSVEVSREDYESHNNVKP